MLGLYLSLLKSLSPLSDGFVCDDALRSVFNLEKNDDMLATFLTVTPLPKRILVAFIGGKGINDTTTRPDERAGNLKGTKGKGGGVD
jgi:hypothetical protein